MISNPHRTQQFIRAVAFFIAGFVITFTAPYHDTAISIALFATTVLVISVLDVVLAMTLAKAFGGSDGDSVGGSATANNRSLAAIRLGLALLASLPLIFVPTAQALAFVLTLWAASSAVVEVWFGWASRTRPGSRELRITGAFAGVTAILLLLLPDTPVSVIGVFGGYCFVVATFIGIAAFDPQESSSQQESTS